MADNRLRYGIVRAIAGAAVLLICIVAVGNIEAAAADTGSICIKYSGQDQGDKEIPLAGAEFVLYQVGTMKDGEWVLTEEFEDSGVSLKDNTASGSRAQAEKLWSYAMEQRIPGTLKKTDESGMAVYDELREGFYMSAQTGQFVYRNQVVFISVPSLISIPAEIDGEVTYQVTIEPKSERKTPEPPKETPKSPEIVKTGDKSAFCVYGMLLFISAGVVVSLVIYKIRREAILRKRQS